MTWTIFIVPWKFELSKFCCTCRVQKKSRLHGCEPEEGFLNLCQFWGRPSSFRKKSHVRKILMHASDLMLHEDNWGTTRETSHKCCIMRKTMSKEVGAGGRFDIFLDSVYLFFLRKPAFCLSLNFLNFFKIEPEIKKKFSKLLLKEIS